MYKRNVQFEIKFWYRSLDLTSVNRITFRPTLVTRVCDRKKSYIFQSTLYIRDVRNSIGIGREATRSRVVSSRRPHYCSSFELYDRGIFVPVPQIGHDEASAILVRLRFVHPWISTRKTARRLLSQLASYSVAFRTWWCNLEHIESSQSRLLKNDHFWTFLRRKNFCSTFKSVSLTGE